MKVCFTSIDTISFSPATHPRQFHSHVSAVNHSLEWLESLHQMYEPTSTRVCCGSEKHAAWPLKCPRRSTKPIDEIPNTQIEPLNKKSREMDATVIKTSRIHSTHHSRYCGHWCLKLNNNINRGELIAKLGKRFVSRYDIDTVKHFSRNGIYIIYILMFDSENPTILPTQPKQGNDNIQEYVDT